MAFAGVCGIVLILIAVSSYAIILFIAIDKANNKLIYDNCGHTLRDLLIAEIVTPIVIRAVCELVMCACIHTEDDKKKIRNKIDAIITVIILILASLIVHHSNIALADSNCKAAMSSKDIENNYGSPLLATMGLVTGGLGITGSIITLLYYVFG